MLILQGVACFEITQHLSKPMISRRWHSIYVQENNALFHGVIWDCSTPLRLINDDHIWKTMPLTWTNYPTVITNYTPKYWTPGIQKLINQVRFGGIYILNFCNHWLGTTHIEEWFFSGLRKSLEFACVFTAADIWSDNPSIEWGFHDFRPATPIWMN